MRSSHQPWTVAARVQDNLHTATQQKIETQQNTHTQASTHPRAPLVNFTRAIRRAVFIQVHAYTLSALLVSIRVPFLNPDVGASLRTLTY